MSLKIVKSDGTRLFYFPLKIGVKRGESVLFFLQLWGKEHNTFYYEELKSNYEERKVSIFDYVFAIFDYVSPVSN